MAQRNLGFFLCHFCLITWILEIGERFCVLLNHDVSIAVEIV